MRNMSGAVLLTAVAALHAAQDAPAPKILLDQPLHAVEYQLERLTNDEIVRLERSDADPKYRPVYFALLTRQGLSKEIRDEALTALVKLDKTSAAGVLLEALGKVGADDASIGDKLLALLFAQPAGALMAQREALRRAAAGDSSSVRRGAYGGLMIADDPDAVWQAAASVGHLPDAILALAAVRPDAQAFRRIAQEVSKGGEVNTSAAIRGLLSIPESAWPPASDLQPLAAALVTLVRRVPPEARTEPPALDALQLADRLSAALPDEVRLAVRRDLRALGVQVVRIATVPEQMAFDLRWFAVEAGAPLQIVVTNADAMPHNLIVGAPKAVEPIGTAAMTMGMPSDPGAKPFVPDSPLVLQATTLLKEGETARLSFTAPRQPGEYVFLCSYPGHWARMYGVMLVVEKLDEWEAHPTVPIDPLTSRPFTSPRRTGG